jgi:hypothetical protein
MKKLTTIKHLVNVIEIKNANALKGGCSCGDKRPKPYNGGQQGGQEGG